MSGIGNIQTFHKQEPAGTAPPFALTSAENGLSVDPLTGRIVLGQAIAQPGNPGAFLSNREIPMAGFSFNMFNGASNQLSISPLTGNYFFGQSNAGNGNGLSIDDLNQRWEIGQSSLVQNLLLSFPSAGIGLSYFDVNGTNPFLIPAPGTGGSTFLSAPDFSGQLQLEEITGRAALGDIGGINFGFKAVVDGGNGLFTIEDSGFNQFLFINGNAGFEFVNVGFLNLSGARLNIVSGAGVQKFTMESAGPSQVPLDFDPVAAIYKLGDTFNNINHCEFIIDVNAQKFQFNQGILQINGTDGFTGSVLNPTQIDVSGGIVTNVI